MSPTSFNEDQFIKYLSYEFEDIGDDCAVLPFNQDISQLVTTDSLVEGTHFTAKTCTPASLGYKSMAVSISDIAAMGGRPQQVLLTLALPESIELDWVQKFMDGAREILDEFDVELVGGDTVRSESCICIGVTTLGYALTHQIKRRSTARPGDHIFVSRKLGGSALGLRELQMGKSQTIAIESHQRPIPEVKLGQELAKFQSVHAMMDLSDGLLVDSERLARASGCRFVIECEKVPQLENAQSIESVICGGEDYALLFTADTDFLNRFSKKYSVYNIGKVFSGSGVKFLHHNKPITIKVKPFQHFKQESGS